MLFLVFLAFPISTFCGGVNQGGLCTTDNDHLDISSHKFTSDCDDRTFCTSSTNGTCQARQCRRDEFPFGFNLGDVLPPLCGSGSYCPDEGNGCRGLVPVGQSCQLNRDDQCTGPPQWKQLSSNQNFNGSLCLQSTCWYANATLGQRCINDQTTYTDIGPDGQQYTNIITRHNCQTPRFFCHLEALQCVPTKLIGETCNDDQECQTYNCRSGSCAEPPETPLKVALWQYATIVIVVLIAMSTTVSVLVVVHKRIRLRTYIELRDYYEHQISLREAMFALHNKVANKQLLSSEKGETSHMSFY
ncbi:hypothetical protein C8Q75DRAFT_793063 [Abortiporus biennis]|nr:hypothetical protein C8Q75DRAFT_793063 [Abortiporus biennis]